MAITPSEIQDRLNEIGYSYQVDEKNPCVTWVTIETLSFVNSAGERSLRLVLSLEEEGEYLTLVAPWAYKAQDCKFKAALLVAMTEFAFKTKLIQMQYDPSDGEVSFAVDLPVEDGTVTTRQLFRMFTTLSSLVEESFPVFAHAMGTGRVDWSLAWERPEALKDQPEGTE